jgi:anti-sigma factor RsiW
MDHELTPEELEALLPAYALDAVDDDERAAIEAYLEGNPDARTEAADLQRAASLLSHAGGPAPRAVWERLEAAISASTPGPARHAPTLPIGRARRRRARPVGWLALAAAVTALAVGAIVAIADPAGQPTTDQQAALAKAAHAAQEAPGAHHVDLRDPSGHTLATAVVLPDGTGYLESHLPALDPDRTYQLWALTGQSAVSLGVMGPRPEVVAFTAAGGPDALAITNEMKGGTPQPTQQPEALGNLS